MPESLVSDNVDLNSSIEIANLPCVGVSRSFCEIQYTRLLVVDPHRKMNVYEYVDQVKQQPQYARACSAIYRHHSTPSPHVTPIPMVGTATVFFGHAWDMNACDLLETIIANMTDDDYAWIDLYMHNQYATPESRTGYATAWIQQFEHLIGEIANVVLLLPPRSIDNIIMPTPFRRAWCLFEIACALRTNATITVIFSHGDTQTVNAGRNETARILEDLMNCSLKISEINFHGAKATVADDLESISDIVSEMDGGMAQTEILVKSGLCLSIMKTMFTFVMRGQEDTPPLQYAQLCDRVANNMTNSWILSNLDGFSKIVNFTNNTNANDKLSHSTLSTTITTNENDNDANNNHANTNTNGENPDDTNTSSNSKNPNNSDIDTDTDTDSDTNTDNDKTVFGFDDHSTNDHNTDNTNSSTNNYNNIEVDLTNTNISNIIDIDSTNTNMSVNSSSSKHKNADADTDTDTNTDTNTNTNANANTNDSPDGFTNGIQNPASELNSSTVDTIWDMILRCYLEAVAIREQFPHDQHLASAYKKIAKLYKQKREHERSLEYFLKALAIKDKQGRGIEHHRISKSYSLHHSRLCSCVGETFKNMGDHDQALKYGLTAFTLQQQHLGPEHVHTLSSMNNVAFMYRKRGNLNKAFEMYSKLVHSQKLVFGAEHPKTMKTLNTIALLFDEIQEEQGGGLVSGGSDDEEADGYYNQYNPHTYSYSDNRSETGRRTDDSDGVSDEETPHRDNSSTETIARTLYFDNNEYTTQSLTV